MNTTLTATSSVTLHARGMTLEVLSLKEGSQMRRAALNDGPWQFLS